MKQAFVMHHSDGEKLLICMMYCKIQIEFCMNVKYVLHSSNHQPHFFSPSLYTVVEREMLLRNLPLMMLLAAAVC